MKIVKITPKFKVHCHGFRYGIRFERYGSDRARQKLNEIYGPGSWHNQWDYNITGRRDRKTRCFLTWIYLHNEADLTLLQLTGALDDC